mmetsp:Transcript_116038/g.333240  ORF Transcript_116038/g.333240 Transcript_116038/m.333240 type:complete len:581 (-) Transcript_116038:164-1906(-)
MASIETSGADGPWRIAMDPVSIRPTPAAERTASSQSQEEAWIKQVHTLADEVSMLASAHRAASAGHAPAASPTQEAAAVPQNNPGLLHAALALQVRLAGLAAATDGSSASQPPLPPARPPAPAPMLGRAPQPQPLRTASQLQQHEYAERTAALVLNALARAGLASQVNEPAPPRFADATSLAQALEILQRPFDAPVAAGANAPYMPSPMAVPFNDPFAQAPLNPPPSWPRDPHLHEEEHSFDEDLLHLGPTLSREPQHSMQQPAAGEWVRAVMEVIPYLDAQQLREALTILDRAIVNVQKAKTLGRLAGTDGQASDAPWGSAADILRQQVWDDQRRLIAQLHAIREAAGAPPRHLVNILDTGERAAPGPRPGGATHAMENGFQGGGFDPHGGGLAPGLDKGQPMTLSMSLQLLAKEDPETLFIVRRINKLGFKAVRKIRHHFNQYGHVVRVLVAHSTVRQGWDTDVSDQWRRRPSSLGFVHMAAAAAVKRVLAHGEEHEVDGCAIRVQQFQRQRRHLSAIEAEQDQQVDPDKDDLERQQSALSGLSTSTGSSGTKGTDGKASRKGAPTQSSETDSAPIGE